VRNDPAWEHEFAASLRTSLPRAGLLELFARFSAGEGAFDELMRRILVRAMCASAGQDLQVGPDVVLKHPETMAFGTVCS
jgi:hypothetical protein